MLRDVWYFACNLIPLKVTSLDKCFYCFAYLIYIKRKYFDVYTFCKKEKKKNKHKTSTINTIQTFLLKTNNEYISYWLWSLVNTNQNTEWFKYSTSLQVGTNRPNGLFQFSSAKTYLVIFYINPHTCTSISTATTFG